MKSQKAKGKALSPLVGIIMGSASDSEHLAPAREILGEFGVPYEFKVVSAHRTPDHMFRYAEQAAKRGIEVIIAGAGGAYPSDRLRQRRRLRRQVRSGGS